VSKRVRLDPPQHALTTVGPQTVTLYDPEQGLQTIAVTEAAEKHWARAKDAGQLLNAIKTKIMAQAEYVVWRDSVVIPSQEKGAPGRGKRVAVQGPVLPDADPGKRVVDRWRKKLCTSNRTQKRVTRIAMDKIKAIFDDATLRCIRICEQQNMGTVRGTEGTGEFERYTPKPYIDAARKVLGAIDLDPATSKQAQRTVQAKRIFTEADDGLEQEWHGRVWVNPPYHRDLAPRFIDKLIAEIEAGRTTAAIMLTNNCTDTSWFDAALRICSAVCFTRGRISFTKPNGAEVVPMGLPTQGQAFFYFGQDVQRFEDVFCTIGSCLRPSRQYEEAVA
jgi:hypothetical protein